MLALAEHRHLRAEHLAGRARRRLPLGLSRVDLGGLVVLVRRARGRPVALPDARAWSLRLRPCGARHLGRGSVVHAHLAAQDVVERVADLALLVDRGAVGHGHEAQLLAHLDALVRRPCLNVRDRRRAEEALARRRLLVQPLPDGVQVLLRPLLRERPQRRPRARDPGPALRRALRRLGIGDGRRRRGLLAAAIVAALARRQLQLRARRLG
mmetsp:Transcript_1364/g.4291  ORF Transcript_1364/g.4291 Transcript_1364/m.4291 type:complete len:211 (-) Transcript_1364:344-976(-)